MKLRLSAAVLASLGALVAFGLFAGPAAAQTVTGSSFRVSSASVSYSVDVQLKEKSGVKVVPSVTPDGEGKFTFRDIPEGEYSLTLVLHEEADTLGATPGPEVKKYRLTLTGGSGRPLTKDFDLKAAKPLPSTIKKLPGRPKFPVITLVKGRRFEGGSSLEGVIAER